MHAYIRAHADSRTVIDAYKITQAKMRVYRVREKERRMHAHASSRTLCMRTWTMLNGRDRFLGVWDLTCCYIMVVIRVMPLMP